MAGVFAAGAVAMVGAAILGVRFGHMVAATIAFGVMLHLAVLSVRRRWRRSGGDERRSNQNNHGISPEFRMKNRVSGVLGRRCGDIRMKVGKVPRKRRAHRLAGNRKRRRCAAIKRWQRGRTGHRALGERGL
jgi:hypothetical protein